VSTDDPNPPAETHLTEVSYTTPIVYREDDMPSSFWESEHSNSTYDESGTEITIEGEATLPSFLVMQSPMSNGASVRTRAMKKPDEEVYFVVIENSANPEYKTIVWFINSTSYASYEFSYNLEWEGVSLLLDNVYYGYGI
jgi:hypothetical protein